MDSYQETFRVWDKVASAYQDAFMDMDLYDDTYDAFCRLVEKPGARIFEIGCGPGNITRYLLSKRPDFAITAIDVSPNMIQLARINNPTADFKVMDCREIDRLDERFDAIMCGFCLPYFSKKDSRKLIKDCAALTVGGGIVYFSAIEGDYASSGYEANSSGDKMYVYYHEEDYLQKALRKHQFEVVEVVRKSYARAGRPLAVHLILIARKMAPVI